MKEKQDRSAESEYLALYEEYFRRVFGWLSKSFDIHTAEDLTQQTFLNLWLYLLSHGANKTDNPKALIFKIAKNAKIDYLRTLSSKPVEPLEYLDEISDGSDNFGKVELVCALSSLTCEERQLINMKMAGFSSSEMAEVLGITPSGARTRLQNAKKKLKTLLS